MAKTKQDQFHEAMLSVYKQAKAECNYTATRFLRMVSEHGGLQAAKILLAASGYSDGFTELWRCKRLDITMEALVLKDEWSDLFTQDELNIARKRLKDYGYASEK
jgi:hypothetical protein